MIISKHILPKIPGPVIGIAVGTLFAYYLQHYGFEIATIGNHFSYVMQNGIVEHGIPPYPPSFHIPGFDGSKLFALPTLHELRILMVPALVIAALAALESLLSATVADGMVGTKHNPNAELVGVGIGNILSGLVAGIPATGAIARTATNIHAGGRTPISSVIHAIFILLYVIFLAPYLSYIPMSALAALLLTVAYRMSHYKQFIRTIQLAPRSDTIVLITCFGFTVFVDMVAGVTAGVVLACFLLVKRIASLTKSDVSHVSTGNNSKNLDLPDDVMIYHIKGSLFFGTVEKALDRTGFIMPQVKTLIIDMVNVPLIDMTGMVAMRTMILDFQTKDRKVILCGNPQVIERILRKLPLIAKGKVGVAETIDQAVKLI
jgi:SulP family sulfate permease